MKRSITFIFAIFLTGCTALVEKPDAALIEEIKGDRTLLASPVDVLALSDEMKTFIDSHVERKWPSSRRLLKLRDILFSKDLFDIQYESGNTKTAIETYSAKAGNCLSMTNLFIAMARYSGLNADYHIVDVVPQWDHVGDTLILTRHINSIGKLGNGDNYILDFLPHLRSNLSREETVSDQYAQAIYYNNLGAESILNNKSNKALAYLRTALDLEPRMADAWNNMGTMQSRMNRLDLAEASFKQAIILSSYSNAAISNLSRLYHNAGKIELSEKLADRVKRYRGKNPYHRYTNAKTAFTKKNYSLARTELEAAIRLKKNETVFFQLLANVHEKLGNKEQQRDSLVVAQYLLKKALKNRSSLEIHHPGTAVIQ